MSENEKSVTKIGGTNITSDSRTKSKQNRKVDGKILFHVRRKSSARNVNIHKIENKAKREKKNYALIPD